MQMTFFVVVHGCSKDIVAATLSKTVSYVTTWLQECCLQLNVSKTVGRYFIKTNKISPDPKIYVNGEKKLVKLQIVSQVDSQLSFKVHIDKLFNIYLTLNYVTK